MTRQPEAECAQVSGAEISRSQGLSARPAVKECDCRLAQQEQRQKTADND